ncbi:MAG: hypothetical protein AB8A40_11280 [Prochlorococcus sp.]
MHEELKTFIVSGTQFQRIVIAHTLIKQPKVLIINAAKDLKNSSQEVIKQTIRGLGITRNSIAHRLSTIKQAVQIVVLEKDKPKPADLGTWDEIKGHGYPTKIVTSH